MTKSAQNSTYMNSAINNVHRVRKWFPKKLEMQEHFGKTCNQLKNVNSALKILKSKLKNLKKRFFQRLYHSV